MSNRFTLLLGVSAAALCAGSLSAQDYYVGLLAGSASGLQYYNPPPTHDLEAQSLSVVGGVSFPLQGAWYFGAEVEASKFVNYATDWSGGAHADAIFRVRAVAGVKLDGFSVFASAGLAKINGPIWEFFTPVDEGGATGPTFGIGADFPVSDRVDIRIEAIRDQLVFSEEPDYRWDATTIRAGAIVNF